MCIILSILLLISIFASISQCLEEAIRITPTPSHAVDLTPRPRTDLPADGFKFVSNVGATSAKQYRKDGNGELQTTSSTTVETPADSTPKNKSITPHYGSCLLKYIPSTCKRSKYCGTKKLCVQISGDPCCAPADGECPTPTQMGIKCVKGNPINWCDHHTDCARNAICCDTGCGYNICVQQFDIREEA